MVKDRVSITVAAIIAPIFLLVGTILAEVTRRAPRSNARHASEPKNGEERWSDGADHRLPLIRLKELRRDLVLALGEDGAVLDTAKLQEIAAVQEAIAAAEAVIADIDAELERPIDIRASRYRLPALFL